jgi:hypothetical protein
MYEFFILLIPYRNYTVAQNFQKNAKKENLYKLPCRVKYNTQLKELHFELLLENTKTSNS